MRHTLRDVPEEVDRKLRERAEILRIAPNEAVIRALKQGTGAAAEPPSPSPDARRLDAFRGIRRDEPWVDGGVRDLAEMNDARLGVKTFP